LNNQENQLLLQLLVHVLVVDLKLVFSCCIHYLW
jgi:hypothetical protein